MSGISIAGTGVYLPERIVKNDHFCDFIETSDEWITTRTGIKERRIADHEPVWYMGRQAALEAMNNAGIEPEMVDMVIVSTITPDYSTPSVSAIIQGELGLVNSFCFDLNAACTGYIYSLDIAKKYLESDEISNLLIVSTEAISRLVDYTDRSTCVLFGDGAAATVVQKSDKIYSSYLKADGKGAKFLYCSNKIEENVFFDSEKYEQMRLFKADRLKGMEMDGKEVYKFATRVLTESVREVCKKAGIDPESLSFVIPHQANIRIIKTASDNLGIGMDRIYTNVDRFGNTSSASIPICLDEMNKNRILKRGDLVAIVGFGAGLTYGAAVFEW